MDHVVKKSYVHLPNERVFINSHSTRLTLGTKYSEIRWFQYLCFDKDPYYIFSNRKVIIFIHTTIENLFAFNIMYLNQYRTNVDTKSVGRKTFKRAKQFAKC